MAKKENIKDTEVKQESPSKESEKKEIKANKQTKSKAKAAKKAAKPTKEEELLKEIEEVKSKHNEINDKYLRLSAEFDNFRKRTLRERMELIKSAGEDVLINILPVVDDFERAIKSMEQATDGDGVKEGVDLIYNKFIEFLKSKGIKEIEAKENDFDTDVHEAITKIPAPEKKLKGKVIDVIEKGYYLNEKVIRFAKVVIGE